MEKLTTATFQRWQGWIEIIKNDVQFMANYLQMYEYFVSVVNANTPHIENHDGLFYCNFVVDCFGGYMATGIRRHLKIDKDSISIMKLLDQLNKSTDQFTYDFYLTQFPLKHGEIEWQKNLFNKFSIDGTRISKAIISSDMDKIAKVSSDVGDFVDRVIAHLDQRGTEIKITFKDIVGSIQLFNEMTCKYLTFLTSENYTSLKPVLQFNVGQIFTVPFDIR